MIDEQEVQTAFDWLARNADKAAEARARRVALEEGRKRIKAIIMKEHAEKAIGAQEREAYADDRYQTHLEGLKAAVYEDERYRWLKDAAIAEIEAFRTFSANRRGLDRVG